MTLNTKVLILDPVDPRELFDWINTNLLHAVNPRVNTSRPGRLDNEPGQGFGAWLMTSFNADGSRIEHCEGVSSEATEWDCPLDDCNDNHEAAHYMQLSFDTAYGFQDELGGCSELHARYIFQLSDHLSVRGVRLGWVNEYDGEYHEGTEGLESLVHSGESAMDWFRNVALPAVSRHFDMEGN